MSSNVDTVLKEALEEAKRRDEVKAQARSANIRLTESDYEEVYKRADAVVETRNYSDKAGTSYATHKAIAAKALMDAIDEARETGVKVLYFREEEILVLADNE